MFPDAVIEFAGESADDGFVAGVREAEAAARKATEMALGADEDDGFSHALDLNGSHHASRRAPVDHDVGSFRGGGRHGKTGKHGSH
jgi:hypothetical protein